MPLLIPEPVVTPLVVPPVFTLGRYTFTLQRPDGTSIELSDGAGYKVQVGVQGLDDPTLDFLEHTPAGWDGSIVDSILAEPREVFLPIQMQAQDLISLRRLKQDLTSYLNARRGPVTLKVSLPDASARLIDGYYRPVPGTMDADNWGVSWQNVGIVIRCPQPFWRSEFDWKVAWVQQDSRPAILPILPLGPADSNALGSANPVTIAGDVETYPVWSITGPLTECTITDVATGRTFTLTAGISSGETWIVDTRRGRQGVFDNTGARSRASLNAGADLFPLQPGVSQVQTTVVGASDGAQVVGTAPQLWLAA